MKPFVTSTRIGLVAIVAGCSVATSPATTEEEGATDGEDLWIASGAQLWPNAVVPVCFAPAGGANIGFTSSEQVRIRDTATQWSSGTNVVFTGWKTCAAGTSMSTGFSVRVYHVDPGTNGSPNCPPNPGAPFCGGQVWPIPGGAFSNRSTNVYLRKTNVAGKPGPWSPPAMDILHEFAHVLGFAHESRSQTDCRERTDGTKVSNTGVNDVAKSITTAGVCGNNATTLSAQDIKGTQRAYRKDADGTSIFHTYNTDPNNSEGAAAHDGRITVCPGPDEVLVGIDQWAWSSQTIQCRAKVGNWITNRVGRIYAFSDPRLIRNGVASCPPGFVAIGVDFPQNRLYCSAITTYRGNGYASDTGNFGHFLYYGVESEIHRCPAGALQGANVTFDSPTAGKAYDFSCVEP